MPVRSVPGRNRSTLDPRTRSRVLWPSWRASSRERKSRRRTTRSIWRRSTRSQVVYSSATMNNPARHAPLVLALALLALPAAAQPGGTLPGPLPLFPADNWWNADVSSAPVDPHSASYIHFIGESVGLHPDFGGDADTPPEIYGMVYISVPGTQPLVPVTFVEYGGESDAGAPGRPAGYPIPDEAKTQVKWMEGGYPGNANPGGDRHMLIVDRDHRILFELYHARWNTARSRWEAGSGAVFPLSMS